MDREKAEILAKQLGGWAWMSGGDVWLAVVERQDGRAVVFSDECVCEYSSVEAMMDGGRARTCINLLSIGHTP